LKHVPVLLSSPISSNVWKNSWQKFTVIFCDISRKIMAKKFQDFPTLKPIFLYKTSSFFYLFASGNIMLALLKLKIGDQTVRYHEMR